MSKSLTRITAGMQKAVDEQIKLIEDTAKYLIGKGETDLMMNEDYARRVFQLGTYIAKLTACKMMEVNPATTIMLDKVA